MHKSFLEYNINANAVYIYNVIFLSVSDSRENSPFQCTPVTVNNHHGAASVPTAPLQYTDPV